MCPECHRRFEETAGRTNCPEDGAPLVRVADMAAADGDPMLGRVLAGRFTILAKLGAGSMGTVYRARQAPIGREVAIKILRSERAVDEVSRARFLREARANSLLTAPNTVTVFDFGQSDSGDFYLAMELLEGESLGARIKRLGRMGVEEAIETARQSLRSLAEAHAKGIIHRDLKPDNLFYARLRTNETYEEIVKVLDFGIAKMLHNDGELAMNVVETQAGTVFGTPRYMSPEQAQGKKLDARSDLYSLGVILYHMVTGRPPFTDDDAIVVMARHIKTMPRTPAEVAPDARIPPEVDALIMRVLSKDPDKRPADADAMAGELAKVREQIVASSGVRSSIADRRGAGGRAGGRRRAVALDRGDRVGRRAAAAPVAHPRGGPRRGAARGAPGGGPRRRAPVVALVFSGRPASRPVCCVRARDRAVVRVDGRAHARAVAGASLEHPHDGRDRPAAPGPRGSAGAARAGAPPAGGERDLEARDGAVGRLRVPRVARPAPGGGAMRRSRFARPVALEPALGGPAPKGSLPKEKW